MTDARLPGHWLNEMRFMDLSDHEWRVFTNLLMWSVEQGTDGRVPTRYVNTVHPDGVSDADIDTLVTCELIKRTPDGLQFLRWDDPHGLRQSLAATVDGYRQRKRKNQADYRQRLKDESVTGHVGEGIKSFDSQSSAYMPGNRTGHVTGNGSKKRHQFTAETAQTMQTVQPGSDCGAGKHLLQPDGTCRACDRRQIAKNDEWMYR
ncbi:hypothetical protein ACO03V_14520 [Microbacterium sp. HMH0099]|uniref:hypothetical protein n=1 Tax=Microbacterium sp. HMH0099 TaxID=3414026 RepID=UPI003BF62089